MKMRPLIYGGVDIESPLVNLGLVVLRLFAGLTLAFQHGINITPPSVAFVDTVNSLGFPLPEFFAWAAGLSELLGGICLVVGLCTRPASFFIVVTMSVAVFLRHSTGPFHEKELALLYGIIAFLFLLVGSGRFGVDDTLRKTTKA